MAVGNTYELFAKAVVYRLGPAICALLLCEYLLAPLCSGHYLQPLVEQSVAFVRQMFKAKLIGETWGLVGLFFGAQVV